MFFCGRSGSIFSKDSQFSQGFIRVFNISGAGIFPGLQSQVHSGPLRWRSGVREKLIGPSTRRDPVWNRKHNLHWVYKGFLILGGRARSQEI